MVINSDGHESMYIDNHGAWTSPLPVPILMRMPDELELLAAYRARFDAIGSQVAKLMDERSAIAEIIRGLERLVDEPSVVRHVDHQPKHKVPEFYSINAAGHQRVYHNNDACRAGRDIPPHERKAGSGGYPICVACALLGNGQNAYRMIADADAEPPGRPLAVQAAFRALEAGQDRAFTAAEIVAWLAERGSRVNYQSLYKALRRVAEKEDGFVVREGDGFRLRKQKGAPHPGGG